MSDEDLVSVYRAANITEAHMVKNLLLEEEIDAYVSEENEPLAGLPIASPDVLVRKSDEARALEIVDRYDELQIQRGERPDWTCPECGVTVLGALDQCESCDADRPGTADDQ